jgi:hypothetical protein
MIEGREQKKGRESLRVHHTPDTCKCQVAKKEDWLKGASVSSTVLKLSHATKWRVLKAKIA